MTFKKSIKHCLAALYYRTNGSYLIHLNQYQHNSTNCYIVYLPVPKTIWRYEQYQIYEWHHRKYLYSMRRFIRLIVRAPISSPDEKEILISNPSLVKRYDVRKGFKEDKKKKIKKNIIQLK